MGQGDVYQFLKQQDPKKWFTAKEIAKELKISPTCVRNNIKRMSDCLQFKQGHIINTRVRLVRLKKDDGAAKTNKQSLGA